MFCRGIIAFYSQIHATHKYNVWPEHRNVEFYTGGSYSEHGYKGLISVTQTIT
jgi:hypothetical protein